VIGDAKKQNKIGLKIIQREHKLMICTRPKHFIDVLKMQ